MSNLTQIATHYHELNLSVVPVGSNKLPTVTWKHRQSELVRPNGEFDTSFGVAIICGAISGMLEVLDVDLKYDVSGTLWSRFKALIREADNTLLKRLVIEKTTAGGYHFIYRCKMDHIDGNLKLASRHTTEQERQDNPKEKVKVLLETRGEGGYFVCAPTDGYALMQGSFDAIPVLTETERNTLIACARSLNEVHDDVVQPKLPKKEKQAGLSPFDDYNERGDILAFLIEQGWTLVKENSINYFLKRAGKSDSKWSATLHKQTNTFFVFSSSTEFEHMKGQSPASVYGTLKHNKDWSATARDLVQQGYGEPMAPSNQPKPSPTAEPQKPVTPLSFLANKERIAEHINHVYNGTLPMGLSTGMPTLDKHFRFKRASFNVVGGMDNVGKTVVILFLMMQSARLHGWKWGIASLENSSGSIMKSLIEFYVGCSLKQLTPSELNNAAKFVSKHFYLIDSEESYSYKDMIRMAEELHTEKKIDGFFIDPYNALELDPTEYKLLGGHDYHYKVTTAFRKFCKKKDCCVYLNCHAVTEAARNIWTKDTAPEKDLAGHVRPPKKSDVEGGGKFANRADDFFIIHRYAFVEDRYRTTEIHVVKIKETDTGGRVTNLNEPVKIEMRLGNCGFIESETRFNPVTGITERQLPASWNNE